MVGKAEKDVITVEQQYRDGVITNGERYNKVIAIWSEVTDKVAKEMFKAMDDREKAIERTESDPDHVAIPAREARRSRFASSRACAD